VKREEILTGALREMGVIAIGETPSAEDTAACAAALDAILDELTDLGQLWSQERQADVAYTAGNTVDLSAYGKIHTVKLLDGAKETLITRDMEKTWIDVVDKTTTGTPTRIYVDSQGIGRFYPVPSANGSIRIYYNRAIPASAAATAPEIPARWGRVLQIGVAVDLAPSYGLPINDRMDIERRWREKRAELMAVDVPAGPAYVEVDE
jgi:hypothetical protein